MVVDSKSHLFPILQMTDKDSRIDKVRGGDECKLRAHKETGIGPFFRSHELPSFISMSFLILMPSFTPNTVTYCELKNKRV